MRDGEITLNVAQPNRAREEQRPAWPAHRPCPVPFAGWCPDECLDRLVEHDRIATRYEKKALYYYRAVWVIGCIFLWLDFANTP